MNSFLYQWIEILFLSDPKQRDQVQNEILTAAYFNQNALSCENSGSNWRLLLLASKAHWTSDSSAMRLVSQQLKNLSPRQKKFLRPFEAELDFLIQSLLGAGESFLLPQPQHSYAVSDFWESLKWAGFRMACGHYKEAIECLSDFKQCEQKYPAAYVLRSCVILGISFQALGNFSESRDYLEQQKLILEKFPSSFLYFALSRRRLSLLIESELLSEALVLEKEMAKSVNLVDSDFMTSVYLQEKFKLAIILGETKQLKFIGEKQEKAIRGSDVPTSLLIPLEERCELSLRESRPKEALKIIAEQAWLSRENGLVNGQLICGMILFRCQMQLLQVQAAHTTVRELKYLCTTYGFGRDGVRTQVLLALWHFHRQNTFEAWKNLDIAERIAQKYELSVHLLAMQLFRLVANPSDVQFRSVFCTEDLEMVRFKASVGLLDQWLTILKWQNLELKLFFDSICEDLCADLNDHNLHLQVLSHYFISFRSWLLVLRVPFESGSPQRAQANCNSSSVLLKFCLTSFAKETDHAALLHYICTNPSEKCLSVEKLHAALFPQVNYVPSRHRTRILAILQRLRAKIRTCFAPYLIKHSPEAAQFGLVEENDFRPNPYPKVWGTFRPGFQRVLTKKIAVPATSKERLDSVTGRNTGPVSQKTIDAMSAKILVWLTTNGSSSGSQMALGLGYARKTLHVYLKQMVIERKINLSGLGRNAQYSLVQKS